MPSMTKTTKHFAEVISSTNEMLTAQCYKEALSDKTTANNVFQGSIVKVSSSHDDSFVAFGLVTKINNSSLDNIHKPQALGLSTKELEHLQPQVFDLLRKEVEIYLFAHKESGKILSYPPKRPLTIHDFVYLVSNEEALELTNDISNIISIAKRNQLKGDCLVNLISLGYTLRSSNYNYLVNAGQQLSIAYTDEYDSLMQLLKRLSHLNQST